MNAADHTEVQNAVTQARPTGPGEAVAQLMQTMGSKVKVASDHMKRARAAIKNRAITSLTTLLPHSVATPQVDRLDLNANAIETAVLACFYVGGHGKISACA